MRYSAEHKESVRARIVAAAAGSLRASGLTGVGIPALMKRVGLTHGGFYAHFDDRDELVAEAVKCAAQQTSERVFVNTTNKDEMLAAYLSSEHVAHPEHGCVLAALGADAFRQAPSVKRQFAEVARGFLRHVAEKLPRPRREDKSAPTDEALRLASQMVGAVILSRLVEDGPLARRILAAARQAPG